MDSINISIIIPVYNSEKFLVRCIQSILLQSFLNYEVILVNDGSTDSSGEICEAFARSDKRIKVIHQQNAGPGNARNAGLEIARGEFVAFVDSDDYIEKDMFQVLYETTELYDADIVQCGFERLDADGNSMGIFYQGKKVISGEYNCVREYSIQKTVNNYLHCKIIRSSIIKNIRFPNLSFSEDTYFLIQAFCLCKTLVLIGGAYYKYVQHINALTQSPFSAKKLDIIKSGKWIHQYVNIRFPNIADYWALYIVLNAEKLYAKVYNKNKFLNQRKELRKVYLEYYQMIQNTEALKGLSPKSRLALKLFKMCPRCHAYLYNFTH